MGLMAMLRLMGALIAWLAAQPPCALALDVPKLVKESQDAVVLVTGLDKQNKPKQFGSGFFVQSDGIVVTNYHVIDGSSGVVVTLPNGALFVVDKIAFGDPARDLAVLQVQGKRLPVLPLGDSDNVKAGEDVVALGNPEGLEGSVSTGVVSAIRRLANRTLVQTTAPISHGSSGGPLLNATGEVIGINTLSMTAGQNLNFAVAINELRTALASGRSEVGSDLDKSQVAYLRGILAENRGDFTAAQSAFSEAIGLNPRSFDAWLELGGVFYEMGETDKEVSAYKKAVDLRPTSPDAHDYLGTAYEEKGEFNEAVAEYQRAIVLKPKYLDAMFDLGLLELVQGHRAESIVVHHQLEVLSAGMAKKLKRLLELTKPVSR